MWLHLLEINSSSVHTYICVCFIRNYYIGLLANNTTLITDRILCMSAHPALESHHWLVMYSLYVTMPSFRISSLTSYVFSVRHHAQPWNLITDRILCTSPHPALESHHWPYSLYVTTPSPWISSLTVFSVRHHAQPSNLITDRILCTFPHPALESHHWLYSLYVTTPSPRISPLTSYVLSVRHHAQPWNLITDRILCTSPHPALESHHWLYSLYVTTPSPRISSLTVFSVRHHAQPSNLITDHILCTSPRPALESHHWPYSLYVTTPSPRISSLTVFSVRHHAQPSNLIPDRILRTSPRPALESHHWPYSPYVTTPSPRISSLTVFSVRHHAQPSNLITDRILFTSPCPALESHHWLVMYSLYITTPSPRISWLTVFSTRHHAQPSNLTTD